MLSYLRQLGVDATLEDSSGNGGASVAAYGATGGMYVKILAPATTSPTKIAQICAYGANIQLADGLREVSEAKAIRQSERIFYSGHNWQRFFLQGTKTVAYESREDLSFHAPDNVTKPVGAGSNAVGCYIGFKELLFAGQIDRLPRIFGAQPLKCSPIDTSFQAGVDTSVERKVIDSISEGTMIKRPSLLRKNLATLRESGEGTVVVREGDSVAALIRLAEHGTFFEPTSATAAGALDSLTRRNVALAARTTVVIVTGSGSKTSQLISEFPADPMNKGVILNCRYLTSPEPGLHCGSSNDIVCLSSLLASVFARTTVRHSRLGLSPLMDLSVHLTLHLHGLLLAARNCHTRGRFNGTRRAPDLVREQPGHLR